MAVFSHASAQGLRAEQQDRWAHARIKTGKVQGELLAVIDGHGGHQAADQVSHLLSVDFLKSLDESNGDVPQAIKMTFDHLDQATRKEVSGTTLSLVFVSSKPPRACVGVLGDSPVVIMDSHGELYISTLHNVRSNQQERAAAVARGGEYVEGYIQDRDHPGEGLQLSRALGDSSLDRILNRQPDLDQVDLCNRSFILLATDGVLDSFDQETDPQIRRLAERVAQGCDAQAIVEDALKRRTGDNVTVIVWKAA